MPIDDIKQFVEKLEKAGELKRVKTEVDSDLENIKNNFQQQQQTLQKLSTEVSKILSKNQFIS